MTRLSFFTALLPIIMLASSCGISKVKDGGESRVLFKQNVNYDDILRQSSTHNKPVIIDFTATWCGPCKVMDQYVFSDIELADRMNHEFISIQIDVDNRAYKDLVSIYDASVLPTLVIVNNKGAELARRTGSLSISGMHRFMDEALLANEK